MRDDQLQLVADLVRLLRLLVLDHAEFIRAGVVDEVLLADHPGPRLVQRQCLGARVRRNRLLEIRVQDGREHGERRREVGVDVVVRFAADLEILTIHEDVAAHLQVGDAGRLRENVVGAGAAAAENLGIQSAAPHLLERVDRRVEALQRLIEAVLESLDVLRPAVVADHAAQLQRGQLVDQPGERERLVAGGHAAARPDGDVDDDVGRDARLARGVVEIERVLRVVDGLDELRILLADGHRPPDLVLRHVRRRHQDRSDPVVGKHFRFAHLRRADADRSARKLQLRNRRTLVRLGVGPARHFERRQIPAHRGDVLFQLVEIDAQCRGIQVPFRHAGQIAALRPRAHFGAGVAARRARCPHRGRAGGHEEAAPRHAGGCTHDLSFIA